ncbi:MAG: archease [Candidatus Geothermarchaeales archaeon]
MTFKYLEDVAIADLAFRAEAESVEELFQVAAMAVSDSMADLSKVRPAVTRVIQLEGESLDHLLFDFLSEIVYLKDSETLIFSRFEIRITRNASCWLRAEMLGERIDRGRHELRQDVKAVTLHMFEVEKRDSRWTATVVLDV